MGQRLSSSTLVMWSSALKLNYSHVAYHVVQKVTMKAKRWRMKDKQNFTFYV